MTEAGDHCTESIDAVSSAQNIAELIGVLNKYRHNLMRRHFPSTDWVRRFFADKKDDINSLGVYLDQSIDADCINAVIWVFGNCTGELRSSGVSFRHVIIDGDSNINIKAFEWAIIHVHNRGGMATVLASHDKQSKVKIFDKLITQ